MSRICGICMIRDALDLVPFLVGHYLRAGFDRLHFIDDQSSDGTFEALATIGKCESRVTVQQVFHNAARQAELMSAAANRMVSEGYETVFPFDADEFWNIDAAQIRAVATRPGLFVGRWVQFVQDRSEGFSRRRGLFNVRYRAPVFADTDAASVESYDRSFVCLSVPKIAFIAGSEVAVARGQHALECGPGEILAQDLEVFHLPLRSAGEIDRRVQRADRVLGIARDGEAWQTRFFRTATQVGLGDVVWAANSASADGFLDLPRQRILLIPDSRFRSLMLRAGRYMLLRHPSVFLRAGHGSGRPQYGQSTSPVST
ncbi:MAG: glycosyltransferase family 2 protein [Inquilinus sp.]|uniref:glycosyltransferase family 2 protein n=1 Tax=Inquilinus sp. TaxID=1932117 RepID=UPI003F2D6078